MKTNFKRIKNDLLESIFINSYGIDGNGKILPCYNAECKNCIFAFGRCSETKERWLKDEITSNNAIYKTWSEVPIDTPVIVWSDGLDKPVKGYFAGVTECSRLFIKIWAHGRTSKTTIDNCVEAHQYGQIDYRSTEK